ncbi:MAG: RecQ family ATP-dependent DNA helicase [Phycisphaeraceae bacterium]|nr:RecQ family ATP-dependent DNA helicase [Phycisphaeraceae bacterium]
MTTTLPHPVHSIPDRIRDVLLKYWGFDAVRPLQNEAISATLAHRDSLVVMPTGGGKSLCYQLPPLLTGQTTLVISPLIALMKDQVDALRLLGYPTAALNSSQSDEETLQTWNDLRAGSLRLVFVSPERLFVGNLIDRLPELGITHIAVDEAHCISQWGHDFRPEYRRLSDLRSRLPKVSLQALTATATPRVREDIAQQLALKNPVNIVGVFDRPNLTYRVHQRTDLVGQTIEAVERHKDGATIVYCISRKDTESLADDLKRHKLKAAAYHAGLAVSTRQRVQEHFKQERLDVVVATVAFGMGIDRSNVRCVIHAAMPKSVEAYQQETGRAGRDGLPAECLLLYSAADAMKWSRIIELSAKEHETDPAQVAHQLHLLEELRRLVTGSRCRHRALSEYFGQEYTPASGAGCGACDICLHEAEAVPESTVIAQKILSCVFRAAGCDPDRPLNYGAKHIVTILRGRATAEVTRRGHHQLSTFGLLADVPADTLSNYIDQLVDVGALGREHGQYPTLYLTSLSWEVLKSKRQVELRATRATQAAPESSATPGAESAAPFDTGLFERLRELRRELATQFGVPAYIIFGDAALQDMSRVRPTSLETFGRVKGVGERKVAEFGERFTGVIAEYCQSRNLSTNNGPTGGTLRRAIRSTAGSKSPAKMRSFEMFDQRRSIEEVAKEVGLTPGTIHEHLAHYIEERKPANIHTWVDPQTYELITTTARKINADRLKPVFEHLAGLVPYEKIRITLTHAMGSRPKGV